MAVVCKPEKAIRFVELKDLDISHTEFIEELMMNLSDNIHMKYSRQVQVDHSLQTCADYIAKIQQSGGAYFQIYTEDKVIGTFTFIPKRDNAVEAGILIFSKFANKGFGRDVWSYAIDYARSLGFKSFHAGTNIGNFPMRKLMEGAKMELDDEKNFPNGSHVTLHDIYFKLQL
jgi:RimJ/RimL family protein N-acetyltransferase